MLLKHVLLLLALSLLSNMTLTVAGLLYIEAVNMVDFVASRYGFPFWWLTHVTVTFAGATDLWHYEVSNLLKDIGLFFFFSLGFWGIVLLLKQRILTRTEIKRRAVEPISEC